MPARRTAPTTAKRTAKSTAKTTAKTTAKKAATKVAKRAGSRSSDPAKDPEGGLTPAGRAKFERDDGSHLKAGVTKPTSEMSLEEMRRKGSWASRFYGRATLPPLKKANGEPTRFALSAHAWGEKVPSTEAQARKIAEKGRTLLSRYHAAKEKERAKGAKATGSAQAKRSAKR